MNENEIEDNRSFLSKAQLDKFSKLSHHVHKIQEQKFKEKNENRLRTQKKDKQ